MKFILFESRQQRRFEYKYRQSLLVSVASVSTINSSLVSPSNPIYHPSLLHSFTNHQNEVLHCRRPARCCRLCRSHKGRRWRCWRHASVRHAVHPDIPGQVQNRSFGLPGPGQDEARDFSMRHDQLYAWRWHAWWRHSWLWRLWRLWRYSWNRRWRPWRSWLLDGLAATQGTLLGLVGKLAVEKHADYRVLQG